MNDLSMPITVNGRHWGGLIVGLKPESLTEWVFNVRGYVPIASVSGLPSVLLLKNCYKPMSF
jgi:hypothetical protein